MQKLNIAINFNSVCFAEMLVRRLLQVSWEFNYHIVSGVCSKDCLLSKYDFVIDSSIFSPGDNVSMLYEMIAEMYYQKTGILLNSSVNSKSIYTFSSCFGGQGVSTLSLRFSQFLSSEYDEKTLFITTDYYYYNSIPRSYIAARKARELQYLINSQREFMLYDYLNIDDHGVYFIFLDDSYFDFLEYLKRETVFKNIIIDYGKRVTFPKGTSDYRVVLQSRLTDISENEAGQLITLPNLCFGDGFVANLAERIRSNERENI